MEASADTAEARGVSSRNGPREQGDYASRACPIPEITEMTA